MKKKGLIVATIVMVVVLAASLTTATYAWFTQTAETTIVPISFSVGAGSDVSIGLKGNNIYNDTPTPSQFYSGTTNIGDGFLTSGTPNGSIPESRSEYWTGDINDLGNNIDMQLDLSSMKKAVGTGYIAGGGADAAVDSTIDLTQARNVATASNAATASKGMIMAEGSGASANVGTVERAFAQRDYLDVVIGVKAAANDLWSIICNVTINPANGNTDLGMNAAIHVAYRIDGMIDAENNNNTDVYKENRYYTTTASLGRTLVGSYETTEAYGGSSSQRLNNGATNLPIVVAATPEVDQDRTFLSRENIYQIHLMIWIDGNDNDCLDAGRGVSSEIYINFGTTHPNRG